MRLQKKKLGFLWRLILFKIIFFNLCTQLKVFVRILILSALCKKTEFYTFFFINNTFILLDNALKVRCSRGNLIYQDLIRVSAAKIFQRIAINRMLFWNGLCYSYSLEKYNNINKFAFKFVRKLTSVLTRRGYKAKLFRYLLNAIYGVKPSFNQQFDCPLQLPRRDFVFFRVIKELKNHFFLRKHIKGRRTTYYPDILFPSKFFRLPLKWFTLGVKTLTQNKKLDEKIVELIYSLDSKGSLSKQLKLEFYKKVSESKINLSRSAGLWRWRKLRAELTNKAWGTTVVKEPRIYHREWRVKRPEVKKNQVFVNWSKEALVKKVLLKQQKSQKFITTKLKRIVNYDDDETDKET